MLRVEFSKPVAPRLPPYPVGGGCAGARRCLPEVLVQLAGALMPSCGECPVMPCALPCVGVANVRPQWGGRAGHPQACEGEGHDASD